jgi:hypothetical protein
VVQTDYKVYHMYDIKNEAHSHSTEQDTQPIAFQIGKQVIPYRTRGGTCCPGVPTPEFWTLADSSATCHDGINHLHHSIHYSNRNIDPHTAKSHLNACKTTTLSQIHNTNSTSQRMKDLHDTYDSMTKHN